MLSNIILAHAQSTIIYKVTLSLVYFIVFPSQDKNARISARLETTTDR